MQADAEPLRDALPPGRLPRGRRGWRTCFGESTSVPQQDPDGVMRIDGLDPRLVQMRGAMILEGQARQLVESLELVIAPDNW